MKSKNPKKDNVSDEFTITRKEALKKLVNTVSIQH